MDETRPTAPGGRPLRQSERIDNACDRFEAAWRAGRAPRIEDFLEAADPADRPALRNELVALEQELRRSGQAGARSETVTDFAAIAEAPTIPPEAVPAGAPLEAVSPSIHDQATLTPSDALSRPLIPDTGPLIVSETPTARIRSPFDDTISPRQASPGQADGAAPACIRYFGDYEITSEIARGGMGVVFRARQISLNRPVALKMILAGQLANEQEVRRFYTEAEAAANLDHPGIVPIFEVGQHEGQHYFSMGFVEGQSVAQRLAAGPLPPREAAALLAKVADSIDYAHQRGVIHRDLKPANILIDANGSPRVTDFGLAKKLQSDSALTGSGQIMGTPSYMPPEQAGGQRGEVGPSADVYALGATLYALITGRPPFQAATAMDTVLQVINDEPVPPRRLNASVPMDLETICLKCLEKDQGKRYATAADLAADLRRFLAGEPIVARPITRIERAVKWVRRRPAIAALSGLTALVAVSALGLVLWQWREAVEAREDADRKAAEAKYQGSLAEGRRLEADARRLEAEQARSASERDQAALKSERDRAEAHLYAARMSLAQSAWDAANTGQVVNLLESERPDPKRIDLRGWEWHYYNRLCNAELRTFRDPGAIGYLSFAAFAPGGRLVASGELIARSGSGTRSAAAWCESCAGIPLRSRDWPSAQTVKPWPRQAGTRQSGSGASPMARFRESSMVTPIG
jgi:hypothetical protein